MSKRRTAFRRVLIQIMKTNESLSPVLLHKRIDRVSAAKRAGSDDFFNKKKIAKHTCTDKASSISEFI